MRAGEVEDIFIKYTNKKSATFYRVLNKLKKAGLIASNDAKKYFITEKGVSTITIK